jgi:hypothetical protein
MSGGAYVIVEKTISAVRAIIEEQAMRYEQQLKNEQHSLRKVRE